MQVTGRKRTQHSSPVHLRTLVMLALRSPPCRADLGQEEKCVHGHESQGRQRRDGQAPVF